MSCGNVLTFGVEYSESNEVLTFGKAVSFAGTVLDQVYDLGVFDQ